MWTMLCYLLQWCGGVDWLGQCCGVWSVICCSDVEGVIDRANAVEYGVLFVAVKWRGWLTGPMLWSMVCYLLQWCGGGDWPGQCCGVWSVICCSDVEGVIEWANAVEYGLLFVVVMWRGWLTGPKLWTMVCYLLQWCGGGDWPGQCCGVWSVICCSDVEGVIDRAKAVDYGLLFVAVMWRAWLTGPMLWSMGCYLLQWCGGRDWPGQCCGVWAVICCSDVEGVIDRANAVDYGLLFVAVMWRGWLTGPMLWSMVCYLLQWCGGGDWPGQCCGVWSVICCSDVEGVIDRANAVEYGLLFVAVMWRGWLTGPMLWSMVCYLLQWCGGGDWPGQCCGLWSVICCSDVEGVIDRANAVEYGLLFVAVMWRGWLTGPMLWSMVCYLLQWCGGGDWPGQCCGVWSVICCSDVEGVIDRANAVEYGLLFVAVMWRGWLTGPMLWSMVCYLLQWCGGGDWPGQCCGVWSVICCSDVEGVIDRANAVEYGLLFVAVMWRGWLTGPMLWSMVCYLLQWCGGGDWPGQCCGVWSVICCSDVEGVIDRANAVEYGLLFVAVMWRGWLTGPMLWSMVCYLLQWCGEGDWPGQCCGVWSVICCSDVEGVIDRANAVEYGLAAGVFTQDISKALHVSDRIQAGTVFINTYNKTDVAAPFGGFKQSGFGKDLGKNTLLTHLAD